MPDLENDALMWLQQYTHGTACRSDLPGDRRRAQSPSIQVLELGYIYSVFTRYHPICKYRDQRRLPSLIDEHCIGSSQDGGNGAALH